MSRVALGCAAFALLGCDIVQGFQDAGDAVFPPVKTYLDVPGYRVAAGKFDYVDMVTTSEPFILARAASDGESLYAMRYHDPKPCRIPGAARYWTNAGPDAARTYIAYQDSSGDNVLRFSDMSCTPYELTLENADFPVGFSPTGLVIRVGATLYDVDPSAGSTTVLAADVQEIDAQRLLVRAGGRIGVFNSKWALERWVGEGVVGWASAFGSTFFQDAAGISRLTLKQAEEQRVASTSSVAVDACDFTILPETAHVQLLAFRSPCASKDYVYWDALSQKLTPLELSADPRHLKIFAPLANGERPRLGVDPTWALYLSDFDAASESGTLVLRTPDGDTTTLGAGAALERSELRAEDGGAALTGGYALLDVAGETGRFVRFGLDGAVTDITSGVIRRPAEPTWSRLLLDVDGTLADLAEIVDGEVVRVAFNVPRRRYAYIDHNSEAPLPGRMAWFHDLVGTSGTLSLADPNPRLATDDQGHEPLYSSVPVARGVHLSQHGFMNDLPGFVYFTHWNDDRSTGRLEYSNVELGFSAIISDHVADYVQPGSGVLYAVPSGDNAGIWLVRGK